MLQQRTETIIKLTNNAREAIEMLLYDSVQESNMNNSDKKYSTHTWNIPTPTYSATLSELHISDDYYGLLEGVKVIVSDQFTQKNKTVHFFTVTLRTKV